MADVTLGLVASGFAVGQLALQLLEVAQKAHHFWSSLEGSDTRITSIKDHLLLIQIVSTNIVDICKEEPGVKCGEAVVKSLRACKKRTDCMLNQISSCNNQAHGIVARNWSRFKQTLKEKTIQGIENQLRGDVMMLLLALQPFFHEVQGTRLKSLAHMDRKYDSTPNSSGHGEILKRPKPTRQEASRNWRTKLSHLQRHRLSIEADSCTTIDKVTSTFGITLSPMWRNIFQYYLVGITYTSTTERLYLSHGDGFLSNFKRRLKLVSPILSFQIQTMNLPRTLKYFPIMPCNSDIFKLSLEGNIEGVRLLLKSGVSPFVVNQHGENLLHAAARYAHADLCIFFLDLHVDGSAFDDRLLTPLDHLARKVCMSFAFPSRVVNTIRALVEKGRCQPLLPLTSNAVSFYQGPEEGFAWLFAAEYAGVNLEDEDSEGWTLLCDAAFNFGWWTRPCLDDPTISWQSLYLLRAGANPHSVSSETGLTPLDAFLRGGTAQQIDNAYKWLQVIAQSGLDLHQYAKTEQRLHGYEQYLLVCWDEELWKWTPTKQRVGYEYGNTTAELEIWLEDFDALSWFRCGRYDLEIFEAASPAESLRRWKGLDVQGSSNLDCTKDIDNAVEIQALERTKLLRYMDSVLQAQWFRILVVSLFFHYAFHLILLHS